MSAHCQSKDYGVEIAVTPGVTSKTSYPSPQAEYVEYVEPEQHPMSMIRELLCEPLAEFFGVMVFIIIGCGTNCSVTLSSNPNSVLGPPRGDWLTVCFGWAVGLSLGAWVSGSISGGHINPAVTLAMATLRGFPWRKVPFYIFAQLLGGICGAGIVYADYIHAIDAFEGGRDVRTLATAGMFGTFAAPYLTNVCAFFEEFVGTFLLLFTICVATDKRKGTAPAERVPIALFLVILGVSAGLGSQTGFALNPARDLGPRLLTAMVGYGTQVFNFRHQYWLWAGVLAPVLGALVGVFLYDLLFYTGSEGIWNKWTGESNRIPRRKVDTV